MRNESGYTLIEAIFQLSVFFLFVHFVLLFFFWQNQIQAKIGHASDTAWELFVLEFQKELSYAQTIDKQRGKEGVIFHTSRGLIAVESNNGVLRKTVDGQGHIPLLTHVKQAKFDIQDSLITVSAEFDTGQEKERTFVIGYLAE